MSDEKIEKYLPAIKFYLLQQDIISSKEWISWTIPLYDDLEPHACIMRNVKIDYC